MQQSIPPLFVSVVWGRHTSMAVYLSMGFCGDMAGLAWLDDEGKEEEEEEEEEGMVVEEEGEWWLCWIRSGRWCMRPAKPFFSAKPWPGCWGWPWLWPGPGEEEGDEDEDERLTNRFMSTVLWKQEQAHLGSSKQVEKRRRCIFGC